MNARANVADILCIGCQKGSTSWLHSVLQHHPDTAFFDDHEPLTSTVKEAHFWDWNRHRGVDWYRTLMTPPQPHRLMMDFTPEYAFLPDDDIAECKALSPAARVIYILRDPLARAVSGVRMQMLWHLGKDHREPLRMDETGQAMLERARLEAHGDYLRNLRSWQRHYPDLLLMHYEDFHQDRPAAIAQVMAFIGLSPARMSADNHKAQAAMLSTRIWESERFTLSAQVLHYLHGLTWHFREDCRRELGMTFQEGASLLASARP
jgi:hypothetical protein